MKYQKRIHWDRYRPEFLKVGFLVAMGICLMAFNYTSAPPVIEPYEVGDLYEDNPIITPPITTQKKDTPPTPPPPDIKKVLEIEPVTEQIVKFESKVEFKEEVKNTIEDEFANDPTPEPAPKVEIIKKEEVEDTAPLIFAERMPIYGSCDVDTEESERRDCTSANLLKHIYENVKYPALAREYETQGTVVVSFIVNKNGDVENVELVKDIGMGCGAEVERVIHKLGKFLPGKQNGRPVAVIYRIPVKFSLQ